MRSYVAIAVLSVIGLSLTALTANASTQGWGVDAPKTDDDKHPAQNQHRRNTYYGGHYLIFYRSPGIRNTRSRRPGGGYRGGK